MISISLVLFALLSVVPLSRPVSGITLYLPGARPGQWVYYGQISTSFYSDIPGITSNQFITPFDHVTSINSTVTAVVQNNVTVSQLWVFNNGTSPRTIVLVGNVATGAGNYTIQGTVPWFIAGGLSAGDNVGAGPAPSINSTTVGSYAGSSWAVNLWNFTYNLSGVQQVVPYFWEENTGLLLEHTYSVSFYLNGFSEIGTLELKATQTNISTYTPDFTMGSSNLSISTMVNTTATTTLTFSTQQNLTVSLTVSSTPSGLSCNLSPVSVNVKVSGSSILSCKGTAGTYQVTVSGASGAKSHTQAFTYQVNSPPAAPQMILGLNPMVFYALIAAIAAVIAITVVALVRRQKSSPPIAPPPTMGPPVSPPPAPAP